MPAAKRPGSLSAALASTLLPPAAWTVFFALETPGKRAAVVYWIVLLVTALPVMHRVASLRRLPTIILRKVRHAPWLICIRDLPVLCRTREQT